MANPLTNRRRAERFAQLVEEASGGRRQHLRTRYDDELAGLTAVPRRLADGARPPELDPEFRTGLRAMLVATAQREGIGATAAPEPPPEPSEPHRPAALAGAVAAAALARLRAIFTQGPRARTAVVAGVAVGAVAFTGMSTASENALPGDALYGVKRSTERAQLALASSDVGRGQLYLEFAETRLTEARTLSGDVERVLGDMDRDTSHGVRLLATAAVSREDPAALDAVDGFVERQRGALESLSAEVTAADRDSVTDSLDLLDAVAERAGELRASLAQGCPTARDLDPLGPVPTDCAGMPGPGEDGDPPAAAHSGAGSPPAPAPTPATGGGEPSGSATGGPGAGDAPAGTTPTPSTTGRTTPDPTDEADSDDPDTGVLDDLNRIVSDLLVR